MLQWIREREKSCLKWSDPPPQGFCKKLYILSKGGMAPTLTRSLVLCCRTCFRCSIWISLIRKNFSFLSMYCFRYSRKQLHQFAAVFVLQHFFTFIFHCWSLANFDRIHYLRLPRTRLHLERLVHTIDNINLRCIYYLCLYACAEGATVGVAINFCRFIVREIPRQLPHYSRKLHATQSISAVDWSCGTFNSEIKKRTCLI